MNMPEEKAGLCSEDNYGIKMRKLRLERGLRIQDAAQRHFAQSTE